MQPKARIWASLRYSKCLATNGCECPTATGGLKRPFSETKILMNNICDPYSDKFCRSGHFSEKDICSKAVISSSDKCRPINRCFRSLCSTYRLLRPLAKTFNYSLGAYWQKIFSCGFRHVFCNNLVTFFSPSFSRPIKHLPDYFFRFSAILSILSLKS